MTSSQVEIYRWFAIFSRVHGRGPQLKDIAKHFKKSSATVHVLLKPIIKAGLISKSGRGKFSLVPDRCAFCYAERKKKRRKTMRATAYEGNLTRTRKDLYEWIIFYIQKHWCFPTLGKMSSHYRVHVITIYERLQILVNMGLITRRNKRYLTVGDCPLCYQEIKK